MNCLYPVKHWLTTLLMGPVILIGYDLFLSSKLMVDALGLLIVFGGFGLVFSLPVFLLYLLTFNWMTRRKISNLIIKVMLDIGSVIAIAVTFLLIIKGSMAVMLTVSYSIAIVASSIFYSIDRKKMEFKDTVR